MNTSNAFSDYMVTYSVNRSINLSPTSGRLHRQKDRGSYGPTICLLNRSREKIEESTAAADSKEEPLLERLLMLSLEVERLGQALREARAEGGLREENERLRAAVARLEGAAAERERAHEEAVGALREKAAVAEGEGRALARRAREAEEEAAELQRRSRAIESAAERAKLDASRMEMSMHFNSTNIDLHKSVARERALEAEALR